MIVSMFKMKNIGIIGGGFSGTMTAVQLIQQSTNPLSITVFETRDTLNRGIAYNPGSGKLLLNVIASKMSAFPDKPDHFLDWVMERKGFAGKDKSLVANSFLPRSIYGDYLEAVWQDALAEAREKNVSVRVMENRVTDLDLSEATILLKPDTGEPLSFSQVVIARGNELPRNPSIDNTDFFKSNLYFQNPWQPAAVKGTPGDLPVLIIGNGLTMVDTVLSLREEGFGGLVISISPNGFNILPHRHNGMKYTGLVEELSEQTSLAELVRLVNKHVKAVREFGVSAEPVIDSLRPHTQQIWKRLTDREREMFMSRLRHLWGVARHRLPTHVHDKIQQQRINGTLEIKSGKIMDLRESDGAVAVAYRDKKTNREEQIRVSRVINCTWPETDIVQSSSLLMRNCLSKGILVQDKLKLGIRAETDTFRVIDAAGQAHARLHTLGSNLKGELWESTAVNELRSQAERLAKALLSASTTSPS